jgi:DNA-binding HxlR family transcriptional regulator
MDTETHAETAEVFCPRYHHAVEVIGRRWTGAIIRAMLGGVARFSDITQTVPGLSDRMLSERLRELEAEGIVERLVFAETPVRIEYRMTEKGRALAAVVESIATWAEEWIPLAEPSPAPGTAGAGSPA